MSFNIQTAINICGISDYGSARFYSLPCFLFICIIRVSGQGPYNYDHVMPNLGWMHTDLRQLEWVYIELLDLWWTKQCKKTRRNQLCNRLATRSFVIILWFGPIDAWVILDLTADTSRSFYQSWQSCHLVVKCWHWMVATQSICIPGYAYILINQICN